jgi:transcription initiation factor TFIIIB Brf1 subunit/transcription initiation factor TFIIB
MKPEEWVERFAAELGAETPSEQEFNAILELAAVAAHSSERTAAPVAAWLAGRSGKPLAEVQGIADGIADA